MPECAPKQKLHHRLQPVRAHRPGAELLARNVRQINDRRSISGEIRLVDGAVDDAAYPDGGTGAPLGLVISQDEKFTDALQ